MSPLLNRAIIKAYWRLLPILFLSYIIAYVDRNNVSLAKLKMVDDLPSFRHRTETIFGLGQVAFFVGYLLLEIPGTLLVEKWSARKWICRIMITWGILASITAVVTQPWHFYLLRFLLGLAEAGFFPGVIVYLTHWFPAQARARALSLFLIATPIAQFVSPKISYYILRMGTTENNIYYRTLFKLKGWQWMYIIWGIPSVVLGIIVLFFLTDRPEDARWLSDDERQALETELSNELTRRQAVGGHLTVFQALRQIKVLLLAAAYFFIVTGNYGVELFLPTILRDWYHPSDAFLTWLLMIPPLGALVGMLVIGFSSDRTKERRFHAAIPILIGAIGLGLTLIQRQPLATMIILFTITSIGTKAYLPAFWSLPSLFLSESAAAGSIGFINSIGNLGGGVGPILLGVFKDRTGSFFFGILFLSISMSFTAIIIMALRFDRQSQQESVRNIRQLPIPDTDGMSFTITTKITPNSTTF
jgi:ACS family tartrate transporter-like MFS transporter